MICLPLRSFSEVGHDGLGSISEITDATGAIIEYYDYDVYGDPTLYNAGGAPISSSIVDNPYYFTGREFDFETGLYYYRARYYDPELGRFLQTDPLGYFDSLNLYSYVFNNPWNYVDPFGLSGEKNGPDYNDPDSIPEPPFPNTTQMLTNLDLNELLGGRTTPSLQGTTPGLGGSGVIMTNTGPIVLPGFNFPGVSFRGGDKGKDGGKQGPRKPPKTPGDVVQNIKDIKNTNPKYQTGRQDSRFKGMKNTIRHPSDVDPYE